MSTTPTPNAVYVRKRGKSYFFDVDGMPVKLDLSGNDEFTFNYNVKGAAVSWWNMYGQYVGMPTYVDGRRFYPHPDAHTCAQMNAVYDALLAKFPELR